MASANAEHYLKTIYELGGKEGLVSLSDLAKELSISLVSTNEMVKKLGQQGAVVYQPYKGVTLTPAGSEMALAVTRRHRLWERFLTDYLKLSWDQVHDEACKLEHATSALVEERLARFMDWPETCPHGHPVPDADGRVAHVATQPLAALKTGQVGLVQSVPEEPELLQYLAEQGLTLLAEFQVIATSPFEGPLTVLVGGVQRVLGYKVASQIKVGFKELNYD